jgi:hypothetical protein
MRILYANVIEQNAGWGAEVFMNRALARLGHETWTIDYRKHRNRLSTRLDDAPEFDVFLLQRGDGFPLPIVGSINRPRFFWASELVARCRDQDRLLKSGLFEHVFFRTPACIDAVVDQGWCQRDRCSVLISAFDPAVHRPLRLGKDIDVLFVGTMTPRRRAWLDTLSRFHPVTVASAFGEHAVELINRARVVLNIHADADLDTETRIFEVLGCGRFLLSEPLSSENPFTPRHLAFAGTPEEMGAAIRQFLEDESAREAVAARGHAAALAGHTYARRAEQIAATMASYEPRPAGPAIKRRPGYVAYRLAEPILAAVRETRRRLGEVRTRLTTPPSSAP